MAIRLSSLPAATLAAATAGVLLVCSPAMAESYLFQRAGSGGAYYDKDGFLLNSASGEPFAMPDGSAFNSIGCVTSSSTPAPGDCGSIGDTLPTGQWYQAPPTPVAAAGQALTTDYGISRARAWTAGRQIGGDGNASDYRLFAASAQSGFHDEITTTSATPVVITFVVALHVDWNDGGVFAFQMGRPGVGNPDAGPPTTPMLGHTWTNCADCVFADDTGSARTLLPGGANGTADLIVTHQFTVLPSSAGDPEAATPFTNPFESILSAFASADDAEVDAYSTATLQSIIVPAGSNISFASGHAYHLQFAPPVPEPATWALWAAGLAGVVLMRRRRDAARRRCSG